MLDALSIDIRHSIRRLRRSPGLSLVVIATVALAIGANTTVLSLLNATFLRSVPASDPDRLVAISTTDTRTNQRGYIYLDTFEAFRAQQRSFSALSMYTSGAYRMNARGVAADVGMEGVMPGYFDLMGSGLTAGRLLTEGDHDLAGGAMPAAVVSERFWRRVFGGDARAVGETITVEARPVTIVGVTSAGFHGLELDAGADLFLPISFVHSLASDPRGPLRARNVIGRLASGVTFQQARAEVVARWPGIQAATSGSLPAAAQSAVKSQRVAVEPLANGFSGLRQQYGTSFVVLIGLTAILLAIGGVNVTGLMLTRALARRQEISVCAALGANRARLCRQWLVEGLLLAMCGLAVALPLAWWSGQVLTAMLSFARPIPLQRPLTPDGRVLAMATSIAIAMGLLIGLIPAWRAVSGRVDHATRRGRAVARTLGRSGRVVLVAQIVLSMVLLVGAGLFLGMLSNLRANDASFRTRNIVWTRLARNPGDRDTLGRPYFQGLIQRLSEIPGVDSAALSSLFPAYLGFPGPLTPSTFAADGTPEGLQVTGLTDAISPGFFRTFGIARLRGRDFTWEDDGKAPAVTIVSETLAGKLFPDGNVIGRRMRLTSGSASADLEIVGVVADVPIGSIREPHVAVAFRPMMQDLPRAQSANAHVRVNGDLSSVRDAYVRVVESQGRHYVRALFMLDDWIDFALLQERLIAGVSTSAATLAVVLACVGIYGLLAYAIASRVREIGVRMALGASPPMVVQMIVRDGLKVAVPGVLIGLPCALGAATLVRSQLYGVTPADPRTMIGSAVSLIVVAVAAALVPAVRASTIDPVDALRHE